MWHACMATVHIMCNLLLSTYTWKKGVTPFQPLLPSRPRRTELFNGLHSTLPTKPCKRPRMAKHPPTPPGLVRGRPLRPTRHADTLRCDFVPRCMPLLYWVAKLTFPYNWASTAGAPHGAHYHTMRCLFRPLFMWRDPQVCKSSAGGQEATCPALRGIPQCGAHTSTTARKSMTRPLWRRLVFSGSSVCCHYGCAKPKVARKARDRGRPNP